MESRNMIHLSDSSLSNWGRLIASTALLLTLFVPLCGAQGKSAQFPKPKHGGTYVIAHRGVHRGIPENSIPAYRKAIELGCDFVEVDARQTKDGKIVSIHNSTVDHYVVGTTGKVSDFTLAALKHLDIGEKTGEEWKNTRVPTFEEILQLCQGRIGIYLDLKEPLVPELVGLIKKYGMERDVVWCVPASAVEAIKSLEETCPECILMPDVGDEKNLIPALEKYKPLVVAPVMGDFSETYVDKAHALGAKVFLDEGKGGVEEWNWILDLGTDGIQTDDPEALIQVLKSRAKK